MTTNRFMVDNNALMALGEHRRASRFFQEHCLIPEDVLYEARYLPDHALLSNLCVGVTPAIIGHVREVMASMKIGNTDLVDLYGNKGTADPVLIGSVTAAVEDEAGTLFPDDWYLVTSDKAVVVTAKAFRVRTKPPHELAQLIDETETT